ncbi:MAG: cytochrome c maturation protein CcmE [Rhodobacteraceae bacterium]|nr:cytochrome c maturation protein CcmE [Paracoccaceae bacterium]
MAGLRKKRRIQMVVVGLSLLAVAAILVSVAFKSGIELYRSPSDVALNPPPETERFKLGGLVVEGSWEKGETHTFIITDTANDINVIYNGILPDLFNEGQGTIVTGTFQEGVFVATEVLAKHDENYMPAEVIDILQDQGVYQDPDT